MRINTHIQNVDPMYRPSMTESMLICSIFSNLVRSKANSYELENDLAERIEQTDERTIDFKLREGVQWHKGWGEVTSEDVKYSLESMVDPANNAVYIDDWAPLERVEILDKYQGKIILSEPAAHLWHVGLPFASGAIVCKKYVEEVGREKFATEPIGSGPYMWDTWIPRQKLTLKRNPDYYGPQPFFEEIQCLPIEDYSPAEVALEAGELDFAEISAPSVLRFEQDPRFQVDVVQTLNYGWIGMNVQNPKLQDINVRKAIRYGIDIPSIHQAAYFGLGTPARAMIAPGLLGHWKDAPLYQRDVERAKDFLKQAGHESLNLRMDFQDTTEYRTWGQIAQENLRDVGINLELNPMDSSAFWALGEGADAVNNVELFGMSYFAEPDPSNVTVWFTCEQVGMWNWMFWCSEEYDALHREGLYTLDNKKREEIYIRMQKLMDDDCIAVWVSYQIHPLAYTREIVPAWTPNGFRQYWAFNVAE